MWVLGSVVGVDRLETQEKGKIPSAGMGRKTPCWKTQAGDKQPKSPCHGCQRQEHSLQRRKGSEIRPQRQNVCLCMLTMAELEVRLPN